MRRLNNIVRSARAQGGYLTGGGGIRHNVLGRSAPKRRKLASDIEDILQHASAIN